MSLTDYAQKRAERVYVRSQAAVGAFSMPTARDAVKLRGSATIPATASDFVLSEEVRDTPDTDQLLKRKKPPAEFTLTTYAKVPTAPGVPPQWDLLMANSYGFSGFVVTLGGGALTGKTLTVTVDGVAVPIVLDAVTDAATLAAAIDASAASSSVAVTVEGTSVIVSRKPGAAEVRLSSDAAPADLGLGSLTYRLRTDILEKLLTIVHGTDNSADFYRDCIVSSVLVRAQGTDEAVLVFTGFLGNSTSAHETTLAGTIGAHVIDEVITFECADIAAQVGPTPEDFAWLMIDAEVFRVTACDPETRIVSAIGGQFGTARVSHAAGAEVHPYLPGDDPDANDLIIGLTLGEFSVSSNPYRIINVEALKDERINPRIDEAFEAALTGYRRPIEGRAVGGTILSYQRRSILALSTYSEHEKEAPAALRLGTAAGPRMVLNWPRFRLGRVDKGEQAAEFTRGFPFQGLASGTPGNDGVTLTVYAGS